MQQSQRSGSSWVRRPLLAALLLTLCGGCSASLKNAGPTRTTTDLPPAPAFMQAVEVSNPKVNEYVEEIAARERAGRRRANKAA